MFTRRGLSLEELYLKNQYVAFCKELGYVGGVNPPNWKLRKRLESVAAKNWRLSY